MTSFMRGEIEGASSRERLRAAELLGKRIGLFDGDGEGDAGPVVITGSGQLPA
jgi:hypothetical protein